MKAMDLSEVRAVLVDQNHSVRQLVSGALWSVGIQDVIPCKHVDEINELFEEPEQDVDLILISVDGERENAVAAVRDIRNRRLGRNPFMVIMAVTWDPVWDVAQPTLEAGIDDLIAAPLSAQILTDRIGNLVFNRKNFVVTMNYVGPERRSAGRQGPDDLPGIAVPNGLRYKAVHDEDANATQQTIDEAMHTIHTHRVYRIANQFTAEIKAIEELVEGEPDPLITGRKVREAAVLAAMAKQKIDAENLVQLSRIGQSMHEVMEAVSRVEIPTRRHLEILRLHGYAVAAAIQERDEASTLLASVLDQAAALVRRDMH